MTRPQREFDSESKWSGTTTTINAGKSDVSFFQPFTRNAPAQPARSGLLNRPLPSVNEGIKEEPENSPRFSSSQTSSEGQLDASATISLGQSSQVLMEDEAISAASQNSIDPEDVASSGSPRPSNQHDDPHRREISSALTQKGLFTHKRSPSRLNREGSDSVNDGGSLLSLQERFCMKRSAPAAGRENTPVQQTKKRCTAGSLQNYTRDTTPIIFQTEIGESSIRKHEHLTSADHRLAARFYRQHNAKLPKRKIHIWSFEEREALFLLAHFYEHDEQSIKVTADIASILNEYFSPPSHDVFRPGQIRAQFREWRNVYCEKSPVYDIREVWTRKKTKLEAAAARVGIALKPRVSELQFGKTKHSPKTQEKVEKNRVWFLATLVRRRAEQQVTAPSPPTSPLGGRSSDAQNTIIPELLEAASSESQSYPSDPPCLQAQTFEESTDEKVVATPPPDISGLQYWSPSPSLLYRVYHDKSGGFNSPTLFRAGMWDYPGNKHIPPSGGEDDIRDNARHHLSREHFRSKLISSTDSLILAMHLATQWEFQGLRPHIAVIDAVSLTASRGVYHAAPIAAEIRKRGNIERLWYKGQNEYFVWGEITQDFILCDLPFDLFRSLTDKDFALVDLLGLEDINPERSLSATRRAFLGQAVVLDAPAGQTIGRAMSLFGLGMTTPSPMVEQFVYNIFQGWALGAMDVQFMAEAFVVGLRDTEEWADNCVILSNDQVDVLKGAFVNGVSRAAKERKKQRQLHKV